MQGAGLFVKPFAISDEAFHGRGGRGVRQYAMASLILYDDIWTMVGLMLRISVLF